MYALTYERLKIEGDFQLQNLLTMKIHARANHHAVLELKGYVAQKNGLDSLFGQLYGSTVFVYETDKMQQPVSPALFVGFVQSAELTEENGLYSAHITALSSTILLDQVRRRRSFQDVTMTYAALAQKVLSGSGDAALSTYTGTEAKIGKPLIQYLETDWGFLKRIVSHLHGALFAGYQTERPTLWFGMCPEKEQRQFPEDEYRLCVSPRYYGLQAEIGGYTRKDFLYYVIRSTQRYALGDWATFRGFTGQIFEIEVRYEEQELWFFYSLGKPALTARRTKYNTLFAGMSLQGTVLMTTNELVHLHLDIDGDRLDTTYPYSWMPTTGNLLYCMPQLGTNATLYFSGRDERSGRATNSPRLKGLVCPGLQDYTKRTLTTEDGKSLNVFPESLGLESRVNPILPLMVKLGDFFGVKIKSPTNLIIAAGDSVTFKAPKVSVSAVEMIRTIRSSSEADERAQNIVPVGTGLQLPKGFMSANISVSAKEKPYSAETMSDVVDKAVNAYEKKRESGENPGTGGSDSGIIINNGFQILGNVGNLKGKEDKKKEKAPAAKPPAISPMELAIFISGISMSILGNVLNLANDSRDPKANRNSILGDTASIIAAILAAVSWPLNKLLSESMTPKIKNTGMPGVVLGARLYKQPISLFNVMDFLERALFKGKESIIAQLMNWAAMAKTADLAKRIAAHREDFEDFSVNLSIGPTVAFMGVGASFKQTFKLT